MHDHLGQWAVDLFKILLMTGSFACGMAFHNCAARYLYALGREDVIPGMRKTIGATHRVHGSPRHRRVRADRCSPLWSCCSSRSPSRDPYTGLYGLMALLGTTAIMIVQALAAFSVIAYFHVHKRHPETANWFTTFLAPLLRRPRHGVRRLPAGQERLVRGGYAATRLDLRRHPVGRRYRRYRWCAAGAVPRSTRIRSGMPNWAVPFWKKPTSADGNHVFLQHHGFQQLSGWSGWTTR